VSESSGVCGGCLNARPCFLTEMSVLYQRSTTHTPSVSSTRYGLATWRFLWLSDPVSTDGIATHLGVTKDTVYAWIADKGLRTHKVGRLRSSRRAGSMSGSETVAQFRHARAPAVAVREHHGRQ